jgi:hypothetical protein
MMANQAKKSSMVPLNWKEVFFANCPIVSASNIDQKLGWTREEFKKIGAHYSFLRSRRENSWYPHYIHNLDNLIRFGGLFPPIHVHADIRRIRLLGATHVIRRRLLKICRQTKRCLRIIRDCLGHRFIPDLHGRCLPQISRRVGARQLGQTCGIPA